MVQTPNKQISLEEFLKLAETKPASEYIDGQITQKPMPQGHHSIIQSELGIEISLALRRTGVATAFPELRCTFGGRSIVPDLAVFENSRIPTNEGQIENVFEIAPDWTIEILSPGQSANKVLKNINHCLLHGAQMGWLIDPEDRSVVISRMDRNLEVIDELDAILPVPEFARSIDLTVDRLFGWLNLI
ncbi:Uma2 family endonuclease [Chamaesiphon sp.]|uniref:Uma2 family endonuclease n=1 Tax=Chamaesiphon sp. TaxID=2814140 RepID=UPI0035948D13